MNKLLEIDMENMVGVVQPGLINMEFQKQLKLLDYFILQIQQVKSIQLLGGNVSENAGGMRAAKWNTLKDYVDGIKGTSKW